MADHNEFNLHRAVEQDDIELVRKLLQQEYNIYEENELGMNSLHLAVHKGNYEITKLLAQDELYINSVCAPSKHSEHNYYGCTPLHFSSKNGDKQITEYLLSKNARLDIQEKQFGNTPLHVAILVKATNIMELLLQNDKVKCFINIQNYSQVSVLHIAVSFGQEDVVENILNLGADTKLSDFHGNTALHLACKTGYINIINLLLNHSKEEINAQNKNGWTPLHDAVRKNNPDLIKILIQFKANTFLVDEFGNTPLHYACESNNLESVYFLVNDKYVVNAKNHQGETPLHVTLHAYSRYIIANSQVQTSQNNDFDNRNEEIVKTLLKYGASLYLYDKLGNTPFHYAVIYIIIKYVDLFLRTDPNIVDIINIEKKTAVIITTENQSNNKTGSSPENNIDNENTNLLLLLLKYNCNINASDGYGNTPLHNACTYNNFEQVKMILDRGGNVNEVDIDKRTPLHVAIRNMSLQKSYTEGYQTNTTKIIMRLLEFDAETDKLDTCGHAPIHYACSYNNCELVRLLIQYGCDVNLKTFFNDSPLHIALYKRFCNSDKSSTANINDISNMIVNDLIKAGADVKAINKLGNTPLHNACIQNNFEAIKCFLNKRCKINSTNNDGKTGLLLYIENQSEIYEIMDCIDLSNSVEDKACDPVTVVKFLIDKGANINFQDYFGNSSIHYACIVNHYELVKLLVNNNAYCSYINNFKQTPLLIVTEKKLPYFLNSPGKEIAQKKFLEIKYNIIQCIKQKYCNYLNAHDTFKRCANKRDKFGNTALHYACRNNYLEIVDDLLNYVDKDIKNNKGKTPLIIAAKERWIPNTNSPIEQHTLRFQSLNTEVIKMLITRGCDTALQDNFGNTALHYACMNNSLQNVNALKSPCTINSKNNKNETPLHIAAQQFWLKLKGLSSEVIEDNLKTSVTVLETLISSLADVNARTFDGNTALHYAAINDIHIIAPLFAVSNCNMNSQNKEGKTALHYCVQRQSSPLNNNETLQTNNEFMRKILSCKACPNVVDIYGNTALHYACMNNNFEQIKLLVENRCSINCQNRDWKSALLIAVDQKHVDKDNNQIIYLLLNNGANANLVDKLGNTVLHYACYYSNVEIVNSLLMLGCDINAPNKNKKTPLTIVAEKKPTKLIESPDNIDTKNNQIIKMLLKSGANPSLADRFGNTPLHYACINNNFELVKLLVESKCIVNCQNNAMKSPLIIAVDKRHDKLLKENNQIIHFLLDNGANPNVTDIFANTSLHYACYHSNVEIVDNLLMLGCDVNAQNTEKKSPLIIAAENKPTELLESPGEDHPGNKESKNNQIIDMLLKSGANSFLADRYRNTAVYYANMNNNGEIFHRFFKNKNESILTTLLSKDK